MSEAVTLSDAITKAHKGRVSPSLELQVAQRLGVELLHGESLGGLRAIPEPPSLLYLWGACLSEGVPRVAIVGSRRATAVGLAQAYRFGRDLAEVGVQVVSGLARGVDSAALEGALAGGGSPCAVLGNGLPRIYPPEKAELATRIRQADGAILTEFPFETPPRKHHFPRRNRLISGLSLGVVVVEAALKSGSLLTARWAAEQGRDVMAMPGSTEGPQFEGCHQLIRDGAFLVACAKDVLEALWIGHPRGEEPGVSRIRAALKDGAKSPEDVVRVTGLSPSVVLRAWSAVLDAGFPDHGDGMS